MQAAISSRQRRSSRLGVVNARIRDQHFAFSLANPMKSTKPPVGLLERVTARPFKVLTKWKWSLKSFWSRLLESMGFKKSAEEQIIS